MISDYDIRPVKVKNLKPELIASYGTYQTVAYDKARKGVAKGIWEIIYDTQAYETTVMMPEVRMPYETKSQKKTKVAWIQDTKVNNNGGAEISAKEVMKVGIDCGFDIVPIIPDDFSQMAINNADILILNNLFNFSDLQMYDIRYATNELRIPYAKYEHDYREIERPEFARPILQNSILNVFLSPAHMIKYQEIFGCEGICLPLAIDTNIFKPVSNVERKPNTAIIPNVRVIRTWDNLKKYIFDHPEIIFDIYSNSPELIIGENIKNHKKVPITEMPRLYSEHEYLVHIGDEYRAGERIIFEAALCGCKVIMNECVGHMSWGCDLIKDIDNLRMWLNQASYQFWKEIDNRLWH